MIPLFDLNYDEAEAAAVARVLGRKWLTMGEETQAFERAFADLIGVRHAFAVANCTAGLHLAYVAAGVSEGDEVICPALTFVATANSAVYAGARPVFADIVGPNDLTIDPDDVARRITAKTKAISVVHYAGYPVDLAPIERLAAEHGLAIIEDVAHGPDIWLADGRAAGSVGKVGCFSFFSNKNLAVGEGGMVTTDDDAVAERLRLMRSHGMTTMTLDRHKGRATSYDVVSPGFNYRMDEIRSALGLAQLAKLPAMQARRRELSDRYRAALADVPGVAVPFAGHPGRSAHHIQPILLPDGTDREAVMVELRRRGVQSSIHYPALHLFSYYRTAFGGHDGQLPQTEAVTRRELTLPLFPTMTDEQLETVVAELAATLVAVGPALAA